MYRFVEKADLYLDLYIILFCIFCLNIFKRVAHKPTDRPNERLASNYNQPRIRVLYSTCYITTLHTIRGCGEREAHIIWSMVTC